MKRRFVLAVLILASLSPPAELFAQTMVLRIRREDSHFGFSIYKWGVFKEEGRFRDFDGTIAFDPRNPATTKVEVVINTASIDSRNEGRDRALRSEDFFHVTRYPSMSFKGVGVGLRGPDTLLVEGDLTIKGTTKRVTVPVRLAGVNRVGGELGTLVGFESEFVINREDFAVGEGWSIIDKNARIHLLIGASSPSIADR